jgi:hypothetical protein
MNEPRCQMMHDDRQCRSQAAGYMIVGDQRWAVCEADWLDSCGPHEGPDPLAPHMFGGFGWEPLVPDPVRAAVARRVVALGEGVFG